MLDNNLPSWRQDLKSSRKKEGKLPSNRWIQLATVNEKNEPRLRTVVFRGWRTETSMLIFTDRRSKKMEHIKLNSNAEILWFFFKTKSQFRFKGKVSELIKNEKYWDTLTAKSKSSWFWEHPGHRVDAERKFSHSIKKDLSKPNNFVVLEFQINSVDLLKLEKPIHMRYIWEKENEWEKVEINP